MIYSDEALQRALKCYSYVTDPSCSIVLAISFKLSHAAASEVLPLTSPSFSALLKVVAMLGYAPGAEKMDMPIASQRLEARGARRRPAYLLPLQLI